VQTARLLKGVAEAVQYAHEPRHPAPRSEAVQRADRRAGRAARDDFGLAKRVDERSHLTLSGQAVGSPSYMRRANGERRKSARRSDVYGLGATLYHALTGQAPFKGETPTDVLHQVLTSEPAAPRSLSPSIPRDLETVCLKCLEKDPKRRYEQRAGGRGGTRAIIDGQPIVRDGSGRRASLRWCRRKPLVRASRRSWRSASRRLVGWLACAPVVATA